MSSNVRGWIIWIAIWAAWFGLFIVIAVHEHGVSR